MFCLIFSHWREYYYFQQALTKDEEDALNALLYSHDQGSEGGDAEQQMNDARSEVASFWFILNQFNQSDF